MKTHAVLAAVLLMLGLAPATATVRIANDTGGQIGPYLAKYRALRASGERIEIDGTCASAYHAVGYHSAKPHLRHAARYSGPPQCMGYGG